MNPRLPLLAGALALSLAGTPAGAQFLSAQGGAIDIEAETTEFIQSENVNRWSGDVRVRQGDAELRADRIDFHFAGRENGMPRGLQRIVATGSVFYSNPSETARSDQAVYTVEDDTIRLTGRVRLVRGPDVFCGHEVELQPRLELFHAVGGGTEESDPKCPGRVRGVIRFEEGGRLGSSAD